MHEGQSYLCPSHRCKPGSQLLGIRQDDGTVAILPEPLPINESFIEAVKQDEMAPEQRFRFTNKCIEGGCNQWTGSACGVVERIVLHLDSLPTLTALPVCGIRNKCRWFSQRQADACKACPFVITEITEQQILEMQMHEEAG
jgi:hypothetical protein